MCCKQVFDSPSRADQTFEDRIDALKKWKDSVRVFPFFLSLFIFFLSHISFSLSYLFLLQLTLILQISSNHDHVEILAHDECKGVKHLEEDLERIIKLGGEGTT